MEMTMKLLYEQKIGTMNVKVLFQQWGLASCDTQGIEVDMAADVILGMESADEETRQWFVDALINIGVGKYFSIISKETNMGVTGVISILNKDLIFIEVIHAFRGAIFIEKMNQCQTCNIL